MYIQSVHDTIFVQWLSFHVHTLHYFISILTYKCTYTVFEYFHCSIPLCLAVVIIQIDPPLTRTISEGGSTNVCVSKDIGSVRAVNFSLTPMDGSAGGKLKCILPSAVCVQCSKLRAAHRHFRTLYYNGHLTY